MIDLELNGVFNDIIDPIGRNLRLPGKPVFNVQNKTTLIKSKF